MEKAIVNFNFDPFTEDAQGRLGLFTSQEIYRDPETGFFAACIDRENGDIDLSEISMNPESGDGIFGTLVPVEVRVGDEPEEGEEDTRPVDHWKLDGIYYTPLTLDHIETPPEGFEALFDGVSVEWRESWSE